MGDKHKKSDKEKSARLARLEKLKSLKKLRSNKRHSKKTSTSKSTQLTRDARLKGLQAKVAEKENVNAVLVKKNRRLEAEKLAQEMIDNDLLVEAEREAEIEIIEAMSDSEFNAAKHLIATTIKVAKQRSCKSNGGQVPRIVEKARKQMRGGYGPVARPASKRVASTGSYLDNNEMFEE